MNEELERLIQKGKTEELQILQEQEELKKKRFGAHKAYFDALVRKLSGEEHEAFLNEPLFKLTDSPLSHNETTYLTDSDKKDHTRRDLYIHDFMGKDSYLVSERNGTLFERYPTIRKQWQIIADLPQDTRLELDYWRYGKQTNKMSAKEFREKILSYQPKLDFWEKRESLDENFLSMLLYSTGEADQKYHFDTIQIRKSGTGQIIFPNEEYVKDMTLLHDWYEQCQKVLKNIEWTVVKRNARREERIPYEYGDHPRDEGFM